MHRAAYCKIAKVVAVEKKVRRRRDDIIAAVELGISNGRVEAINNKIKLTVRMAYGFRNLDNLFAMVMLRCSGLEVPLPGRLFLLLTLGGGLLRRAPREAAMAVIIGLLAVGRTWILCDNLL